MFPSQVAGVHEGDDGQGQLALCWDTALMAPTNSIC